MKSIFRFLFAVFSLLTTTNPLLAQWVQTNGPYGGYISSFAISGTNLFVGTDDGGVYRSTNNGTSWMVVNSGLTNSYVFSLAVSGINLFAGTEDGGVFLSTDNSTSWTAVNSGLTISAVRSLAVSRTNLFAGTQRGVFLSTNNGTSWTAVNSGLTISAVPSLAVSDTNLFAATYGSGVFFSTNNGTSWTAVNSGLTNLNVLSLAVSGTSLFAGTASNGVWRRPLSEMITTVERSSTDLPTLFSLDQNYPNPFNSSTTIRFSLPSTSFVSLKVFDALGREVSNLVSEELSAETYSRQWTGADLPSGAYFYRLQASSFIETKKLILIK